MGVAEDFATIRAEVAAAEAAVASAAIRTLHVTSTFLDGPNRYVVGQDYEVPAGLAYYASLNGWGTDIG